jgi:3-dehydroquinate synthetase
MANVDLGLRKWNVNCQKEINYDIILTEEVLNPYNEMLLAGGRKKGSRRFVVVDRFIYNMYKDQLVTYFEKNEIHSKIVPFDSGEKNKSLENYIQVFQELDKFPIDRRGEPIIAIGGGVVTDVIGFIASSYRRGIPHIKVPTTLMGYVDASVGIKVGVNFNGNKNRMGSFEPPKAVILDKGFLESLPTRHILNGVGEIVKLAVIKDINLFEDLERNGSECIETKFQNSYGDRILDASISGMLEELEPNLYEDNLERSVDFGHTFSLVLEMYNVDNMLHGEAVAIDVAFSTVLANVHSILSLKEQNRILALIKNLNLPYFHKSLIPKHLWECLIERTHHRDGLQRVPLPNSIGNCVFVNDITHEEIVQTCTIMEKLFKE